MTYTAVAVMILLIMDGYIISQIHKHEIAIAELLKKHPDMLIGGDEDGSCD